MKKIMMTLVAMLTIAATGKAMSYEQARNEALFLTDKMAYELNLTDAQYEAAYEINLDYLMGVTSYDDVYSTYWERRNLDMSYILLDWQWQAFLAASYFYRPLYWDAGYWHFAIYARYPHRDYFYFGRPVFYASYRGGHAWHHVGGHGYYYGRRDHFRTAPGHSHFGMLDRWNRGDFRGNHRHSGGHHGSFGGNRNSSTRSTVHQHRDFGQRPNTGYERDNRNSGGSFSRDNRNSNSGGSFSRDNRMSSERTTGRLTNGSRPSRSTETMNSRSSRSIESMSSSRSSRSFESMSNRPSRSSGSFSSSPSRSSGSFSSSPSRSSGSFGGSRSSGSFSSGHSSGHSASGGRSFGGRR